MARRDWGLGALAVAVVVACGSSGGNGGTSGDAGDDGGSSGGSSGGSGSGSGGPREGGTVLPDGSVAPTAACKSAGGTAPVQKPSFRRNIAAGETGWFSSPAVVDLDGDGKKEIVAPLYSTFVFDASGKQLAKGTATQGRVYAPGVVADLDDDGITEIVVGGNNGTVAAYEFKSGTLSVEGGLAGEHVQRRAVPRGARHGGGGSRRRRQDRGRRHDDEHVDDRRAGVRLRARRHALPARGTSFRRGLATTRHRPGDDATSTARATPATAATARTSASATSTTTRSSRSSSRTTTTRSTCSSTTARRSSRRAGSRTRQTQYLGQAHGLGAVHPLGRPDAWSATTTTRTPARGPT